MLRPLSAICAIAALGAPLGVHAQASGGEAPLRVLWADSTTSWDGPVSPSGRFLPYLDFTAGNLWLRDFASGTSRMLTTDMSLSPSAGRVTNPLLSPDERQVAYVWLTSDNTSQVKIADVSGALPRAVPTTMQNVTLVGWSGADELVVSSVLSPTVAELGFLNINTGRFRSILRTRSAFRTVKLSPDGRFFVVGDFRADSLALREIRIVDVATGATRALVSDSASNDHPTWTADGSAVLFTRERGADIGVYRQAVAGGKATGAPTKLFALSTPMAILGVGERGAVFLAKAGYGLTAYEARVDWTTGTGQEVKALHAAPFTDSRRAVFSPDGSKLEFEAKWSPNGVHPGWVTPTIVSLSDGSQRSYPTPLTIRDAPVWSDDGRSLLFIAEWVGGTGEGGDVPWEFWRLDLAKGVYTREGVMRTPGQLRAVGTTRRSVLYLKNVFTPPAGAIEEFDLMTHTSRVLYQTAGSVINGAALSSDGRRIALAVPSPSSREFTVSILTLPGTEPKPLITLGRTARPQISWLRGDQSLLVSGRLKDQDGLWRMPIDGSAPALMRLEQSGFTEARVSPDGEHLTYTIRSRTPHSIWIYEPRR